MHGLERKADKWNIELGSKFLNIYLISSFILYFYLWCIWDHNELEYKLNNNETCQSSWKLLCYASILLIIDEEVKDRKLEGVAERKEVTDSRGSFAFSAIPESKQLTKLTN